MTATLAEFLLARLAEDEQVARAASAHRGPEWCVEEQPPPRWGDASPDETVLAHGKPIAVSDSDYGGLLIVDHIARWDPARVLAEVEAKRAIIALHPARGVQGGPPYRWACRCCDYAPTDWEGYVDYPCPTLQTLASPYASHPDYDPAWAPQT